jgi:hypothetical protein
VRPWKRDYDPPDNLTALESAVLEWSLAQTPMLQTEANRDLKVFRRKWTVVGWYVDFRNQATVNSEESYGCYGVDVLIEGDGIEHGGAAQLYILKSPNWDIVTQELFAYGNFFAETVETFTIASTASAGQS